MRQCCLILKALAPSLTSEAAAPGGSADAVKDAATALTRVLLNESLPEESW